MMNCSLELLISMFFSALDVVIQIVILDIYKPDVLKLVCVTFLLLHAKGNVHETERKTRVICFKHYHKTFS